MSVVIPTKDRPDELARMLDTVAAQSRPPREVIVVDASTEPVEAVVRRDRGLATRYVRHLPPSSAQQRNHGLETVSTDVDYVMFVDDDVLLHPDAFERMFAYFASAPRRVAGAALNAVDHEERSAMGLRRSPLVNGLGLYSGTPGGVAPSGWQSAVSTVDEVVSVEWLSTCAVWWHHDAIRARRFDDFFVGYSYLEDLDFSLGLAAEHDLVVVPDARFEHLPAKSGRQSRYAFGRMEVENRLYVVRKHGLSVSRCLAAMFLRAGLTVAEVIRSRGEERMSRLAGNLVGLGSSRGLLGAEARRYLREARSSTAG